MCYQRAWRSERLAERQVRAEQEIERATSGLRRVASDAGKLRVAGDQRSPGEAPDDLAPRLRRPDQGLLTRREWDVLAHVADGATNRVITHRLTLSEDTVKTHIRHILHKLGVSGRASAVAWFLEVGRGAQ